MTTVIIRHLGLQDYLATWQAMKHFTDQRDENSLDEIWALEHPPVFTQGQNGKPEHILQLGTFPLVQTDRGGQITYHGPGQLVIYALIDVQRKKFNIRQLVSHLEQSVIQLLASYHILGETQCKAPGVYVANKKICSVGLRIRRGRSYHGLAFNVDMDLAPFSRINPCGYSGLQMTQLATLIGPLPFQPIADQLVEYLTTNLGYTNCLIKTEPLYGT